MTKITKEHPLEPRIYHWVHLLAIIALAFTGLYIHWPFLPVAMVTMRFIHFVAMYVLVFTLLIRLSYAFISRNRDWRKFGLGWKQWKMIPGTLAYYLFLRRKLPEGAGEYNPLQRITYIVFVLLVIAQALTGFALYALTASYLTWLTIFIGGLVKVRAWHFFITWLFIVLAGVHVYLSLFEDFSEFKYMLLGIKPAEERE